MRKYIFTYSGHIEGYKIFKSFKRLKSFLNKIPEYELKKISTKMFDGEFYWIGKYFILKKGGLSVKFK